MFGQKIHADHIIASKSKDADEALGSKRETVWLVLLDEATQALAAYPSTSKSTSECCKALKHFVGRKEAVQLHCDTSKEPELAADEPKLIYDPTVPYRKTAVINAKIRTLEDVARCCMAQIGNVTKMWPHAIQFAANALTIPNWSKIHDVPFLGIQYPFGPLIHYKPHHQNQKLWTKTRPGLFLGSYHCCHDSCST